MILCHTIVKGLPVILKKILKNQLHFSHITRMHLSIQFDVNLSPDRTLVNKQSIESKYFEMEVNGVNHSQSRYNDTYIFGQFHKMLAA